MPEPRARVLDVGNCDPDHGSIRRLLAEHFDVELDRAGSVSEGLERMRQRPYRLVLFNRLMDADGSEGIELLRQAKADSALAATPIMMISNYDDALAASVAAGAEPGFGKMTLFDPETVELLARFLPRA